MDDGAKSNEVDSDNSKQEKSSTRGQKKKSAVLDKQKHKTK